MATAYEVVKSHYDANDRGDIDGMLAPIAENCQWTEMDGFPCRGTYVGPQAVLENVFMKLGGEWQGYTFTLERLLDAGDSIIGVGNYTGTYKATGKSMNVRVVHVWGVEAQKVVRFEQFTDTLRIAEAMD